MKYEEFEARAKSAFDDCSEMKRMLWNMQTVVGAVPDTVRKNERLDRKRAELRQENAALKAELDDLKGNAEGFEPDAYMRLPLDADGVPIRIGDKVWYVGSDLEITKSEPQEVVGLVSVFCADGTYIMTRDYTDKATRPNMLTHNPPEPPDSWEKLEEDALKYQCAYFFGISEDKNTTCVNCKKSSEVTGIPCRLNMQIDLVKRAKRLAGIEEQEGDVCERCRNEVDDKNVRRRKSRRGSNVVGR